MARYLVLLKFNSEQNAYNFVHNPYNSAVLGATEADVTSGYIGPSGPSTDIGQPSSAPSSTYHYVDIYVSSPNQIPTGYYNPNPNTPSATQLILDLSTRVPIYVSPNIDPNSITLKEGDNTIIQDGIPAPDWTPPDPTIDSPIEFKPIYYPGQDPNEVYKQYLKLIADIPSDPDVMGRQPYDPFNPLDPRNQQLPETFPRPPATPEDVTREPGYDPMAPYDDTPYPPPEGREGPRFFPDKGIENPLDLPPWADPYIYKQSPDFPDKPKIDKISLPSGGASGGFTQGAPVQTAQWLFSISGDLVTIGPPFTGPETVIAPTTIFASGYYSDVIFTLQTTTPPSDPNLAVTWVSASIPKFSLPAWITSSPVQGNVASPVQIDSAIGALSFSGNFELFGEFVNSSLGVGFYGGPGTHLGDTFPPPTYAGGYQSSTLTNQDLGITMPINIGGFSAIYSGSNTSFPTTWKVKQIHVAFGSHLLVTVDFSF